MLKKYDKVIAMVFALLTIVFIVVFLTNDSFFEWSFARHHNILSWYVRPLFIVPMVYFALRKSYAGVSLSIFCLFTSMFWFSATQQTDPKVLGFLAYEMDYLKGTWDTKKILFSLSVPLFFYLLIVSAWKRKWYLLLYTVVLAAFFKLLWSVVSSGASGWSVAKPALVGLVICVLFILITRRKDKK